MLRISGALQNLMRGGLTLRVIALDVSKGKSYVGSYAILGIIYVPNKYKCVFFEIRDDRES
ncbi:hypothetical protein, partial [Halolactibacillus alkaliphilus]|uniref:hypothetical protein n=1 Tax=Halolactibacillus alkaliphilus TaxID=442899 RepID=UPI001C3FAE17